MQNYMTYMNASELLDTSVDVCKKAFGRQLAHTALVCFVGGIWFLISSVITALLFSGVFGGFTAVLVAGLALFWYACLVTGHMVYSERAFLNRPKRRIAWVFKSLFRVCGCLLVQGLIIAAASAIAAVPAVGLTFAAEYVDSSAAAVVAYVIFLLFFVLIGAAAVLVVTNFFALATAVSVFEERSFFGALARARRLIYGDFWRILGLRVIWWLSILAFTICGQSVFGLINIVLVAIAEMVGLGTLMGLIVAPFGMAAMALVSAAAVPLPAILQTLMYYNQRVKMREELEDEL